MAKKSLTDLLREEVQKSPEQQGKQVQEITAIETSQMTTRSKPSTRTASPTKAELETTIAELRAALKNAEQAAPNNEINTNELTKALTESQNKEKLLQQQIVALEAELQKQKQTVEKLQNNVEKLEPIKIELEKAKTAALRLADINEKLTQEIDTLKKQNEVLNAQAHKEPEHQLGRPIQKEREKSDDFAKKAWLL